MKFYKILSQRAADAVVTSHWVSQLIATSCPAKGLSPSRPLPAAELRAAASWLSFPQDQGGGEPRQEPLKSAPSPLNKMLEARTSFALLF